MTEIPKLKRINIHSELELKVWLKKNSSQKESVMLVTHSNTSHQKHVSREQIGEMLAEHGWKAGSRYTLGSDLLAHVISKPVS